MLVLVSLGIMTQVLHLGTSRAGQQATQGTGNNTNGLIGHLLQVEGSPTRGNWKQQAYTRHTKDSTHHFRHLDLFAGGLANRFALEQQVAQGSARDAGYMHDVFENSPHCRQLWETYYGTGARGPPPTLLGEGGSGDIQMDLPPWQKGLAATRAAVCAYLQAAYEAGPHDAMTSGKPCNESTGKGTGNGPLQAGEPHRAARDHHTHTNGNGAGGSAGRPSARDQRMRCAGC